MVDQQSDMDVEAGPERRLVSGERSPHRHPKEERLDELNRYGALGCGGDFSTRLTMLSRWIYW